MKKLKGNNLLQKEISYEKFAVYFFSFLIFYKIIGVTIHKQYGFGFYYWGIQDPILFFVSFLFILSKLNKVSIILQPKFFLLNLFFIFIIAYQFYYLINDNNPLRTYEDLATFLFKDVTYILVTITSILIFRNLVYYSKIKVLLYLYLLTILSFFIYDFHIQKNIILALTFGPNFSYLLKDSLPGYTWGFHLFFSPFFTVFSIYLLTFLKQFKRNRLLVLVSFLTIYVLILAGGRGTLLCFLLVLFLFILSKKAKIISLLLGLALITIMPFVVDFFSDNQRIYDLLTFNIQNDGSGQGRLNQLLLNSKIIENNLFLGEFLSYKEGQYIHNMLSILQDYGLFVFILFIFILLHSLTLFIFNNNLIKNDIDFIIARNIFFYSLIEIIFFKYSSTIQSLLMPLITYGYIVYKTNNIQGNNIEKY